MTLPFVVSLSNHEWKAMHTECVPFDKPVLSPVRSFDKLRTNGIERLRANGF